ncbi:MAG TPA: GtrA family protein [Candidatus Aphodousia faecavium]|uniref:GtrA family protein n=1 Tax=Parasutterella secunda TaxID=626947 RepID=A0ABS2GRH1_9BURK|nr:GtrA family protein [Parasutterella secunda]MBM6927944.1 GtrA family protein [Parasutterella secunda]HIT96194.1 GtrA family protein [Candidatus Aphodousia faecavium]
MDEKLKQFLTYATIGVVNTGIHWGAFGCFYNFLDCSQSISNLLGFLIAVTFSYVMNAKFTFKKEQNLAGYLRMVVVMASISWGIGWCADQSSWHPMVTLVLSSATSLVLGFILSKLLVFR